MMPLLPFIVRSARVQLRMLWHAKAVLHRHCKGSANAKPFSRWHSQAGSLAGKAVTG